MCITTAYNPHVFIILHIHVHNISHMHHTCISQRPANRAITSSRQPANRSKLLQVDGHRRHLVGQCGTARRARAAAVVLPVPVLED